MQTRYIAASQREWSIAAATCCACPLARARLRSGWHATKNTWTARRSSAALVWPSSRLYLVCGAYPDGSHLPDLLREAIAGGVEIVQLREKRLPDEELIVGRRRGARAVRAARRAADRQRPPAASRVEAGADGVHVGQDDMPVAEVRELVGPDMLIGLSTHSPAQIDAVDPSLVDYIGVGPIHETPTKPGRPAVGVELCATRRRTRRCRSSRSAACDAGNLAEVLDAGAARVCVLRAIADARGPRAAARELRDAARRALRGRQMSSSGRRSRRARPRAAAAAPRRARRAAPRARSSRSARTSARRRCSSRSPSARCSRSAVLVGAASVHDLARHGGSLPGAVFLALVLLRARAGHVPAAATGRCSPSRRCWPFRSSSPRSRWSSPRRSSRPASAWSAIGLGGWLFWKLVRVMGRIQAGERAQAGRPGRLR